MPRNLFCYTGYMKHKTTIKISLGLSLTVLTAQPVFALTASQIATAEGKKLTNNQCTGTDKPKLTKLPMRLQDTGFLIPYGIMVGGHVTPVDHMYVSPKVFNSKPSTYNVYAMVDSHIVDIGTRQHTGQGQNKNLTVTDYRLIFSVSCHLLYYYDLVNSLTPPIKKIYDAYQKNKSGKTLNIPVKAGQVIGKIGGQTLDYAVWDMDVNLKGLLVPKSYLGEAWKIHTVDPLKYVTPAVKAQMLTKYLRTAKPVSGKIDYDVDGRLVGTWFQKGTNGYAGKVGGGGSGNWKGHLSFAPNQWDPLQFEISIGNWTPEASQFAILGNRPDPVLVTPATGLVKYNLVQFDMIGPDGNIWTGTTPASPLRLVQKTDIQGCLLAQLTGQRTLKAQRFQGPACSDVAGFTTSAVTYER